MNSSSLRKASLIIAIIGLAILVILLNKSPKEVSSLDNEGLNEKVSITGKVAEERILDNFSILQINGMEAICECKSSYKNKNVRIIGLVEEYKGKKQIRVLEIKVLS